MPIYRVRFPLSWKGRIIPAGTVDQLDFVKPEARAILEHKGSIMKASTPPLGILPQWEARAARMLNAGIVTVEDLVDANPEELADSIGSSPETVRGWQTEVMKWVIVEPSANTG